MVAEESALAQILKINLIGRLLVLFVICIFVILILHLFIFEDAAAQTRHGQSEAVKRFEAIYSSELVGGEVVFTDYEMIVGQR